MSIRVALSLLSAGEWIPHLKKIEGDYQGSSIKRIKGFFFSKMREIFRLHRTWISEDLPTPSEDCWNFRKTSEDRQRFSMTSEDCRSFPTTSEDERDERFSTTSKQGAPMIFKGFLTNPEHYERVLKMFWRFLECLIKQLHSLLSVSCEVLSGCMRSQFSICRRETRA